MKPHRNKRSTHELFRIPQAFRVSSYLLINMTTLNKGLKLLSVMKCHSLQSFVFCLEV